MTPHARHRIVADRADVVDRGLKTDAFQDRGRSRLEFMGTEPMWTFRT